MLGSSNWKGSVDAEPIAGSERGHTCKYSMKNLKLLDSNEVAAENMIIANATVRKERD